VGARRTSDDGNIRHSGKAKVSNSSRERENFVNYHAQATMVCMAAFLQSEQINLMWVKSYRLGAERCAVAIQPAAWMATSLRSSQ
jgi:hypothetical protein